MHEALADGLLSLFVSYVSGCRCWTLVTWGLDKEINFLSCSYSILTLDCNHSSLIDAHGFLPSAQSMLDKILLTVHKSYHLELRVQVEDSSVSIWFLERQQCATTLHYCDTLATVLQSQFTSWHTLYKFRAVATGPVSPVSTGPLFSPLMGGLPDVAN